MAARSRSALCGSPRSCSFNLPSAFLEWFLIALIFVNAALSYLARRLACRWKLRAPCLLCSSIDSVFGDGNAWLSSDSVCCAHKMQISSLAYCLSHKKLVYADDACQGCLHRSPGDREATSARKTAIVRPSHEKDTISPTRTCLCCGDPIRRTTDASSRIQIGMGSSGGKPPREMLSGRSEKNAGSYPLQNVEYSKLNITSDSEAELPFSDDDGYHKGFGTTPLPKETVLQVLPKSSPNDIVLEKVIHQVPLGPTSSRSSIGEPSDILSPEDGNGFEDFSWNQTDGRAKPQGIDVKSRPVDGGSNVSTVGPTDLLKQNLEGAGASEFSDASSTVESHKEVTGAKGVKPLSIDASARMLIERSESLKRAIGNRVGIQSPKFSEMLLSRSQEDLKAIQLQVSSRGADASWSEMSSSPRSVQADETTLSDDTKRMPSERNSSGEPTEVEGGEASVGLKRLVEMHKNSLRVLYKELEEERSASSVAASEAMAMITRLQEEKATMQMEALQYLRVMEEQSEYDQEAIQRLNDLLTEREKEILDLEEELSTYRSKFGNEQPEEDNEISNSSQTSANPFNSGSSRAVKNFSLGFEADKAYILESLERLEESLTKVSADEVTEGTAPNGKIPNGYHDMGSDEHIEHHVDNQSEEAVNSGSHIGYTAEIKALKEEIAKLNRRFRAIEQDQHFLEHTLRLIRDRDNGAQFIQEITGYLQELRRISVERGEKIVA